MIANVDATVPKKPLLQIVDDDPLIADTLSFSMNSARAPQPVRSCSKRRPSALRSWSPRPCAVASKPHCGWRMATSVRPRLLGINRTTLDNRMQSCAKEL